MLVSGGAPGVDTTAATAGAFAGLRVAVLRPEPLLPHELGPRPDWPWWMPEEPAGYRRAVEEYRLALRALVGRYLIALHELDPDEDPLLDAGRTVYLADRYSSFGQAAHARNSLVVRVSARVVAFHWRESRGTAHTLSEAKRLDRPAHRYVLEGRELCLAS